MATVARRICDSGVCIVFGAVATALHTHARNAQQLRITKIARHKNEIKTYLATVARGICDSGVCIVFDAGAKALHTHARNAQQLRIT